MLNELTEFLGIFRNSKLRYMDTVLSMARLFCANAGIPAKCLELIHSAPSESNGLTVCAVLERERNIFVFIAHDFFSYINEIRKVLQGHYMTTLRLLTKSKFSICLTAGIV